MNSLWRRAWAGGVVAALLAASATAAPPVYKQQNRIYGNSAYGASCTDIFNGSFCRDVVAYENYDVKGTFEYTEVAISNSRNVYDPTDGSYSFGYRYLSCPVDRQALSADKDAVSLEAMLDPSAPGCNSGGYIESWDPVNGPQYQEWVFPVVMHVTGEWLDPFYYYESLSNQKNTYYDGWSGTTTKNVEHCRYLSGDWMRAGGFSINARSWAFEGPDGPAWSGFSLSSCNSNNKQR